MNKEPDIPKWTRWKPKRDSKVKKEIRERQYRQSKINKARNGKRGVTVIRMYDGKYIQVGSYPQNNSLKGD